MNSNIKRFTIVAIAVGLVCVLLVGSALALNVSYQKVSMPDPYGIMPLSLNDDSSVRTFYTSKAIRVGISSSSYSTISAGSSSSFNYSSGSNIVIGSYSISSSNSWYLYIPSGTYTDIIAPVSFQKSDFKSLVFSGGGSVQFCVYSSAPSYPSTAQLLINGLPVGSSVAVSSTGSFTFTDLEVELTDDVTSVGVRFTFNSTINSTYTSSGTSSTRALVISLSDSISVIPVEADSIDYVPYFERVISWLQTVSGHILTSNDWLYQIADSISLLGSSDGALSRLSTVFATDDDIQLKEDSAPIASAATDAFYNQETSTAITTEKVLSLIHI